MSATKEQTVYVKNISSEKSEKEVRDFFSFCGKIQSIEVTPTDGTQSATVVFEKETAAKTALLLDNTALGNTQVKVTSATGSTEDDGSHFTSNAERDDDEITQEQKPRSRIVAEYLAHGYVIGDQALQKAIDLDKKHGVTDRFYSTLQNLDKKYQGTEKAKSIDQSYGVTQKVATTTNTLWSGLSSYYEKAAATGPGKKFANFYSQSSRQVQDIHSEARRLADLKKEESGTTKVPGSDEKTKCKCGSVSENCPCAPGQCACADCQKSDVKKVEGGKTKCACNGNTKNCGCAPGECACSSCPKATMEILPGGKTKCGACGGDSKKCLCEAGKCACDNGCAKANVTEVVGGRTTCTQCKGDSGNCPCEAGKCACDGCGKASV